MCMCRPQGIGSALRARGLNGHCWGCSSIACQSVTLGGLFNLSVTQFLTCNMRNHNSIYCRRQDLNELICVKHLERGLVGRIIKMLVLMFQMEIHHASAPGFTSQDVLLPKNISLLSILVPNFLIQSLVISSMDTPTSS